MPSQGVVRGQVDAVGEQPAVAREAGEAARRVDVGGALADVDVDAHPQVLGQACGGAEGLIRAGEGGMDSHQATAALPAGNARSRPDRAARRQVRGGR